MTKPDFIATTIGSILIAIGVIWGAFSIGNQYLIRSDAARGEAITCKHSYTNHKVVIKNDVADPQITHADLCDTITFTNADNEIRLVAFGPHEHHVAYGGIKEKVLGFNQSFTIQLNQAGTYHFHDHIHDEVTGQFAVTLDDSRINL